MGAPTPSKKTVGAIIKFLETALQRGVDLLSVFGRYDKVREFLLAICLSC